MLELILILLSVIISWFLRAKRCKILLIGNDWNVILAHRQLYHNSPNDIVTLFKRSNSSREFSTNQKDPPIFEPKILLTATPKELAKLAEVSGASIRDITTIYKNLDMKDTVITKGKKDHTMKGINNRFINLIYDEHIVTVDNFWYLNVNNGVLVFSSNDEGIIDIWLTENLIVCCGPCLSMSRFIDTRPGSRVVWSEVGITVKIASTNTSSRITHRTVGDIHNVTVENSLNKWFLFAPIIILNSHHIFNGYLVDRLLVSQAITPGDIKRRINAKVSPLRSMILSNDNYLVFHRDHNDLKLESNVYCLHVSYLECTVSPARDIMILAEVIRSRIMK